MKLARLLTALSCLFLAAAGARAQFPGDVPDTFRLDLGGMYAWFNTNVTFQENLTPGGPIGAGVDLEDVIGIPASHAGFAARGYWKPLNRFYIDFGYVGFSRSGTKSASVDIPFDGVTYTAGASVTGSMKSNLPYLDLRYDFIENQNLKLGLTLGAAWTFLKADLTAGAGVVGPGGPIVGDSVTREAEISIPVPLLGFLTDVKLADRLSGGLVFSGLFAPVHPYIGSVFLAEAHVDWFATKNFGVGGAFQYTKFHIKRDDGITLVEFSYSYYGPKAYVIITF